MRLFNLIGGRAYSAGIPDAWIGNVSTTGAKVIVYSDAATSAMELQYATTGTLAGATTVTGVKSNDVFTFTLTGLTANTIYYFGFDDSPVVGRFRTFPVGPAHFTIAAGGDTGSLSDFPGPGATSNTIAYDRIVDRMPLLFLHLGDIHYQNLNTTDPVEYRDTYVDVMSNSRFSRLTRLVPTDYVWDDHDYSANDGDGTYTGKAAAQQVYRERVPYWTLPSATEIYHTFVIGRVRFIQLDSRSGRTPNGATDNSSKTRLGATQKQWFKDTLLAATEPVIVVNVVAWIGNTSGFADGWDSFSTERTELFNYFEANDLMERLFLIGADIHELMTDDGTNTNFASGAVDPGPPYVGLAPLDAQFLHLGATAQNVYQVTKQQYGTLQFTDTGTQITVTAQGWACEFNGTESEVFTLQKVYPG